MCATPIKPSAPTDAASAATSDAAPAAEWVRDLAGALRETRDARHAEAGIDMDQILTERAEQRARWDALEAAEAAAKKAAKTAAAPPPAGPAAISDTKALTTLIEESLNDEEAEPPNTAMPQDVTYEGGYPAMLALLDKRRAPISYGEGESLPPLDVNLAPYCTEIIGKVPSEIKSSRSGYATKYRALARELKGLPMLCHLHAMLIAHLRKESQPPHCAALFVRLWTEHTDLLLEHLNARWQVSAITTFSEHGLTEGQRRSGLGLSVLLNTMKLYESERLYSGAKPKQPHSTKTQVRGRLPLEMDTYSIVNGGLDVALLGRLWVDAEEDEVIRPLAQNLLEMLNKDTRNVFRRMRMMRTQLVEMRASRSAKRRALMAAYDAAVEAEEAAARTQSTAAESPAPDLAEVAEKAAARLAADDTGPTRRPARQPKD